MKTTAASSIIVVTWSYMLYYKFSIDNLQYSTYYT